MGDTTNNEMLARRKLLKLAAYAAPAVVSLVALKANAQVCPPSCNPGVCPPWGRCPPERCPPRCTPICP